MQNHPVGLVRAPALAAALALATALPAAAAELDQVVSTRKQYNVAAVASQKKIDELADQTDALVADYKSTLEQIDALRIYNRQMQELVNAQQTEIDSLLSQIDDVELVGRQVTPLMESMIDALEKFVRLDVPFLPGERGERMASLRELMARADVTNAEKYRKIMEAYQIENEFGRTIEAYQGTVPHAGGERSVDFLRVGRVAFVYLTLDGSEAYGWASAAGGTGGGEWVPLPADYRSSIRKGLRIARKQAAPDLITLPIAAPEDAQQ